MPEAAERVPRVLDIEAIKDLLPHRYPMLLVDRILDFEPGKWIRGVKNITAGDPVFLGHFPQKSVFPGVLIVEAMAQTGGCLVLQGLADRHSKLLYFMAIDKAKFRRPVVPGDQMVMDIEVISHKSKVVKLRAMASVGGQKVAEAELMSMMVDVEKGEGR